MSTDEGIKHKYIPTGIEGFDEVIGSSNGHGVVESQSILLAGAAGSRKTSLALKLCEGLTKQTVRPMLMASGEQNNNDVLALCQLLKVSSSQIKIHGNTSNVYDILALCDNYKPFMGVFDSLQAISEGSGMNNEAVAKVITQYCKRTKMIAIIISHLTKDLSIKGGTGAPHYVDTICMYEPFIPSMDGNPVELFGRKVAQEIVWSGDMEEKIPKLRVLVGGAHGKNRYGDIDQKAYFLTGDDGELVLLRKKPKVIPFGSRD